jgi:hypothetical protein
VRLLKLDWTADSTILLASLFVGILFSIIFIEKVVRARKYSVGKEKLGEIID